MSLVDKNRLSVLIVDDEAFQRRILREVLRNLGFAKIKEADSGQFAVVAMTEQNFDLVLSDVQMPGMNGLELLRQIRMGQTQLARDARFIILTSFSNTEVLGAAMALDVNGFLAKPIRIGVVMEKIDRAVQEAFQPRAPDDYESIVTDLPSLEDSGHEPGGASARHTDKSVAAANEKATPIAQLRVGMCVTRALVADDGKLLIPTGTVLTQLFINRLWDLSALVSGHVVYVASTPRGDGKAAD
jgi:YesN/AraC family two-component response regulator